VKRITAGLLPLYVQLYDDSMPDMRKGVEKFLNEAKMELEKRGLEIISAPVCRVEAEFAAAVKMFEEKAADAIITLHLAYSPSLESIVPLSATRLPLIVFDTTPSYDFSPLQDIDAILYNHGIHGVQDMCNLLLRHGKEFHIEAGHLYESDVADRVAACAKACCMAAQMRNARVGIIGKPFCGMGDFQLPYETLKATIGMEVITYDDSSGASCRACVSDEDIRLEMASDYEMYNVRSLPEEVHKQSAIANLMVRRWIEKEALTGFTVNFLDITKTFGIPRMPFMEASKAMTRGIGYAGEGDVLTAAFVGAVMSAGFEASFTEMFCPGWRDNTIFLSHMGEMNLNLAAEKPLVIEADFPYTDAGNPAVAYGRFKGGEAVYANLAPGAGNAYSLILSKICMMDVQGQDNMEESIHGWFEPSMPVADFLKKYSMAGGTHHGAVIYGDALKELEMFGRLMKWNVIII